VGGDEGASELVERLQSGEEDPGIRIRAAEALGDIAGPDVLSALLSIVRSREGGADSHDGAIRAAAALSVADIGNENAEEPLLAALGDESEAVRQAAAEGLGQVVTPAAVEGLERALQDTDRSVAVAASAALHHIANRVDKSEESCSIRTLTGALARHSSRGLVSAPARQTLVKTNPIGLRTQRDVTARSSTRR
jgi:HEAT repeat protein